jgi:hypothetical protein
MESPKWPRQAPSIDDLFPDRTTMDGIQAHPCWFCRLWNSTISHNVEADIAVVGLLPSTWQEELLILLDLVNDRHKGIDKIQKDSIQIHSQNPGGTRQDGDERAMWLNLKYFKDRASAQTCETKLRALANRSNMTARSLK